MLWAKKDQNSVQFYKDVDKSKLLPSDKLYTDNNKIIIILKHSYSADLGVIHVFSASIGYARP